MGNCVYLRDAPEISSPTRRRAYFKCFCGNEFTGLIDNIKHLKTKSCGCISPGKGINPKRAKKKYLSRKTFRTHGLSHIPEYQVWKQIKRRCYNPKCSDYKMWGARGIKMFDEWVNSFRSFIDYMGRRPTSEHTIERIDNDKGYEPGNVKWATQKEQNFNRSITIRVRYRGKIYAAIELIEIFGMRKKYMRTTRKNYERILLPIYGVEFI